MDTDVGRAAEALTKYKAGRGPGFRFTWKECEAGGTVGRRLARIPPAFWEV